MNHPNFQSWVFILTAVTVVIAASYDYKRRLIPNFITFPSIFIGLLMHGIYAGWSGFYFSLWGLLVGGGVFLMFYLMGGIGAGDVKLVGSVGAFLGGEKVLTSLILTVLIGGIMAIGKLYKKNIDPLKDTIPYGVAIAAGTLMTLALY